jgi:hypothetical protein
MGPLTLSGFSSPSSSSSSSSSSTQAAAPLDSFFEMVHLPKLSQVGGTFSLKGLRGLRELQLSSLEMVGGDFEMMQLPLLNDVGGLRLRVLGGGFRVMDTGIVRIGGGALGFTRVSAASGASSGSSSGSFGGGAMGGGGAGVVPGFEVVSNGRLESLEMGQLLEVVGGHSAGFKVTLNKENLVLDAGKLSSVEGEVKVSQVSRIELGSLGHVGRSLDVSETMLTSLEMGLLKFVGESLVVRSNPMLANMSMPMLERIQGSLSMDSDEGLKDLGNAFPVLQAVQGSVNLTLSSLESLAFPNMREVRGGMEVRSSSERLDCRALRGWRGGVVLGQFVCVAGSLVEADRSVLLGGGGGGRHGGGNGTFTNTTTGGGSGGNTAGAKGTFTNSQGDETHTASSAQGSVTSLYFGALFTFVLVYALSMMGV